MDTSTRLEDGTVSYLAIATLVDGFDALDRLGMPAIMRHCFSVAQWFFHALGALKHFTGKPVARLYGTTQFETPNVQGPTVAFNLLRSDGTWHSPAEVEQLAGLKGVHLRTGCFCNAGACHRALGISEDALKQNVARGYACGDALDVLDGRVLGAIRVSFGYMSTIEDATAVVQFVRDAFEEAGPADAGLVQLAALADSAVHGSARPDIDQRGAAATPLVLSALRLFPIKSCGALEVESWELDERGLLYDRAWMVLGGSGACLTQKQHPRMCLVR